MQFILLTLAVIILAVIAFFFVGYATPAKHITWGVNFSPAETEYLKLDTKETYSALLEDLGTKNIKLSVDWNTIEVKDDDYDFSSIDWYVKKTEENNAKLIMAVGMKTPRWPECHIPQWGMNMTESEQQQQILDMLKTVVLRYKDSPSVYAWQVENEPFLNFGSCPWMDKDFLKKEVSYVKSLDPNHPVIVTDSGELSLWTRMGSTGADIVGVTTYRMVWQEYFKYYLTYIYPPVFYHRRAELLKWLYNKPVIGSELQAEPWCSQSVMNASLSEQNKTMNPEQLEKNIQFAKNTGFDTFYFWGAEWWYWMKTVHNDPGIWNEAKQLFLEQ